MKTVVKNVKNLIVYSIDYSSTYWNGFPGMGARVIRGFPRLGLDFFQKQVLESRNVVMLNDEDRGEECSKSHRSIDFSSTYWDGCPSYSCSFSPDTLITQSIFDDFLKF